MGSSDRTSRLLRVSTVNRLPSISASRTESTDATVEQEDVDVQDMRNTQGRDPKAMVQQGTRQVALAQTP